MSSHGQNVGNHYSYEGVAATLTQNQLCAIPRAVKDLPRAEAWENIALTPSAVNLGVGKADLGNASIQGYYFQANKSSVQDVSNALGLPVWGVGDVLFFAGRVMARIGNIRTIGQAKQYVEESFDQGLELTGLHLAKLKQARDLLGEPVESKRASDAPWQQTLSQLGGWSRVKSFLGAKHLSYGDGGRSLSFKFPNRKRSKPNFVKITVNPRDYYDIEFGRIQKYDYKVLESFTDVPGENLVDVFQRTTGLYLSF